jgi:predicted SAM-dependent methyltransferase
VGCGSDQREGFVHCDLRKMRHVSVVCKAWELDRHFVDADVIYSRHTIEHLQHEDVERYFRSAFTALKVGGTIETVVPNMDFHVEQWQRAVWDHAHWIDKKSDARHGFAGFWGWQTEKKNDPPFWDTHKSGFCAASLRFFLARAGFSHIVTKADGAHLHATAKKMLEFGERQVKPESCLIRGDHRGRYYWAASILGERRRVCDLACGVGHGTRILADTGLYEEVCGVDIDVESVAYAEEFYSHPHATFRTGDVASDVWGEHTEAVVSFETLEHLTDPGTFLSRVHAALQPGGMFLCSTPNQETMPFSKQRFPFHVRHYSPSEFRSLLETHGFSIVSMHSQHDIQSMDVADDDSGKFLLAVATPSSAPA